MTSAEAYILVPTSTFSPNCKRRREDQKSSQLKFWGQTKLTRVQWCYREELQPFGRRLCHQREKQNLDACIVWNTSSPSIIGYSLYLSFSFFMWFFHLHKGENLMYFMHTVSRANNTFHPTCPLPFFTFLRPCFFIFLRILWWYTLNFLYNHKLNPALRIQ